MRIVYLADHPEHASTVARWHHREWARFNPGDTAAARAERYRRTLGRRAIPTMLLGLDEGGAPIGTAALLDRDMDDAPELTPWLASVFVVPERRGEGLGSALAERATDEARGLGVRRLYLFTPDRERLYARLGWRVRERRLYEGEPVVVMERQLSPADDR